MEYIMALTANAEHFKTVLSNLRAASNAFKDIPLDIMSGYNPYITINNEINCLNTFKKGCNKDITGIYMKNIKTSSDLTSNGRFIHNINSGDFLTISRRFRDYLLSDVGLWCVDIKACEARIAGELAQDSKMIDDYESGDLYSFLDVPRDEYKKAFLTYLNGGKDVYDIASRYPVLRDWRLKEMRSNAKYITLFDGEKVEREHSYRDISKLIQGNGAAILRQALKDLSFKGHTNLIHLHDAVYCNSFEVDDVSKALKRIIPFRVESFELTTNHE